MSNLQHFNFPLEAIQYRTECPICKSEMLIDSKDIVGPIEYSKNNRLVFELDHMSDDMIFVDVVTGNIEVSFQKNSRHYQTGTFSNPIKTGIYPTVMSESFTIKCQNHGHHYYTIEIWLDFDLNKVADIYLKSDFISWQDSENIVHEIVNYYDLETTRYLYYKNTNNYKPFSGLSAVNMPMVPLNLSSPEETVSRIKNLLPFL